MEGNCKVATNVTWHHSLVSRSDKEKLLNQKGILLWFTGISASGKSSIAHELEARLFQRGNFTAVMDGDNIRHGLNANLGFSPGDRSENIRRIGEVAKLFVENGIITMTAFISPYIADRDKVRCTMQDKGFAEIYVKCPLEVAEGRDPKGIYKKARAGLIKDFTGISAPYEEPQVPEMTLDTSEKTLEESVDAIMNFLYEAGVIKK